ncbi:MAG: hypothetical protein JKY95_09695 [Planctomycetaceae bacterium]|nr:hypothetical protein [Planctomycetaceae bacterium]
MKNFNIALASLTISTLLAGAAFAAPTLAPQPGYIPAESEQKLQPYVVAQAPELYSNVIYRDLRKVAPCAVPYLVQVPVEQLCCDPCTHCLRTETVCVTIKLCVPPCKCPCVIVRRNGRKLIYDFGEYRVRVIVRNDGRVIVNYDA